MTILPDIIVNYRWYVGGFDDQEIHTILKKCLVESGHSVLNFVEHRFSPEGYTSLWLLAESHLALHTFPNHELSYIELTSCNKAKAMLFVASLKASSLSILSDTSC